MLWSDVKKWGIPSKFLRISPLYVYELVQLYKQKARANRESKQLGILVMNGTDSLTRFGSQLLSIFALSLIDSF